MAELLCISIVLVVVFIIARWMWELGDELAKEEDDGGEEESEDEDDSNAEEG